MKQIECLAVCPQKGLPRYYRVLGEDDVADMDGVVKPVLKLEWKEDRRGPTPGMLRIGYFHCNLYSWEYVCEA